MIVNYFTCDGCATRIEVKDRQTPPKPWSILVYSDPQQMQQTCHFCENACLLAWLQKADKANSIGVSYTIGGKLYKGVVYRERDNHTETAERTNTLLSGNGWRINI